MSEQEKDMWAFSIDDGETWELSWSREETITEGMTAARDGDHATFIISPASGTSVEECFPGASELIELAINYARSNVFHDSEIDFPNGAEAALDVMLGHTISAWVEIYGVTCTAFTADIMRADLITVTRPDAWEHGDGKTNGCCPKCLNDTSHIILESYGDEIRRVQCSACSSIHAFKKPSSKMT